MAEVSLHTEVEVREGQIVRVALHGPYDDPEGSVLYDNHDRSVPQSTWSCILNPELRWASTTERTPDSGGWFRDPETETDEIERCKTMPRGAGTGETITAAVWDAFDNLHEVLYDRLEEIEMREEYIDELEATLDDIDPERMIPDYEPLHGGPDDEYTWSPPVERD